VVTEFQGFAWLPAGNGLLVSRAAGGDDKTGVLEVTLSRVLLDGSPAKPLGRMRLPVYMGGFIGSVNYRLHPDGSRIAFERHTGMLAQFWAIDNLAQFIKSGASPAGPPGRHNR
jgi:hypothetical protein